MRADQVAALLTPGGRAVLAEAERLAGRPPLAAASALRAARVDADLAAAALTQAELRGRAREKFGADAARMLFTRAGLEQATRLGVAARRAARLAAAGATTVADLGCGIGADAIAFARAGMRVLAVESDPATAAVAAANAAALDLADRISVTCADARTAELGDVDAVFCDPGRRDAGTGRRVWRPEDWSPPWEFVATLPHRIPRTVLKLAPGIDHGLIPAGAEAEWVSVDGDVVEATVWCGPLAEVPRRASLLRTAGTHDSAGTARWPPVAAELTGTGTTTAPVGPLAGHLYDPDGAVVRSHLVAEFAATVGGHLADAAIAYVYTDSPVPTPFGTPLRIEAAAPFSLKRLRAMLREREVGRITIRKRGSAVDVERLRADLRLRGPAEAEVVLTRDHGAPVMLLCRPPRG